MKSTFSGSKHKPLRTPSPAEISPAFVQGRCRSKFASASVAPEHIPEEILKRFAISLTDGTDPAASGTDALGCNVNSYGSGTYSDQPNRFSLTVSLACPNIKQNKCCLLAGQRQGCLLSQVGLPGTWLETQGRAVVSQVSW